MKRLRGLSAKGEAAVRDDMHTRLTVALCTEWWCLTSVALVHGAGTHAMSLALLGTARSWEANSVASVPPGLVNDGDALTFWGSSEPTTNPPKDIGIVWAEPQSIGGVRIRF